MVCFGVQAEHVIASTTKGVRVIMAGSFRTRAWTDADGDEHTRLEVLAEEIGPSLRWAPPRLLPATGLGGLSGAVPAAGGLYVFRLSNWRGPSVFNEAHRRVSTVSRPVSDRGVRAGLHRS
jgi:single-stranded DNA-binding protein